MTQVSFKQGRRNRLTPTERAAMQDEALCRARLGIAMTNYPAIFEGFMAKGIPADQIEPRENVLTYHAWRAVGRQVKRGEHGVKVVTWIPIAGKEQADGTTAPGRKICRTAVVFHISQTEEIQAQAS